jgi:aldehyde:ferredoxin oxidoreductase
MGGRFASSLKHSGYDVVVIIGKAKTPKYILVNDGRIEVSEGSELMGKSPQEVLASLSTIMKDFEVCAIGIAGENLVRYGNIIHPRLNGRPGVAGRGGLGAVMGSKNLKAVVVQHGKGREVYSESLLREIKHRIQTALIDRTAHLTSIGTAFGVEVINAFGGLGTRNAREETFELASAISGEKLKEKYYRKNISCNSCPVACGKLCDLDGRLVKNPEYETLYSLGSMVGIGDLEAIMRANILCDEYGLDTISMGVTTAFAIDCFENGFISAQRAGSRTLKFGDAGLVLALIEETAHRQGLGDLLAEGTKRMSKTIGGDSWKYAYQVKGLEIAGHSPRVVKSVAIGYPTNTRGGSHQDARPRWNVEDWDTYEGKVELAIADQHLSAVGDSLVQCRFIMESGLGREFNSEYSTLLKAVTGLELSPPELNEIGERIVNMEGVFNVKEGIQRKDDTLPFKVMWEVIPQGPHKGEKIDQKKLEELLTNYYQVRGWDENGIPRQETIERLRIKNNGSSNAA